MHLFRCRVSKSVDGTPSIPSLLCKRGLPQYRALGCRQQECPCAETGAGHAATESLDDLCTDPKCDCDCNGHTPRNPETSVERPARLLVVPEPVTSANVHTFRRFVAHLQRDASSLETQKRHSVQHFGQNLLQIAPDILDLVDSDAPVAFGADGLAHLPAIARRVDRPCRHGFAPSAVGLPLHRSRAMLSRSSVPSSLRTHRSATSQISPSTAPSFRLLSLSELLRQRPSDA